MTNPSLELAVDNCLQKIHRDYLNAMNSATREIERKAITNTVRRYAARKLKEAAALCKCAGSQRYCCRQDLADDILALTNELKTSTDIRRAQRALPKARKRGKP